MTRLSSPAAYLATRIAYLARQISDEIRFTSDEIRAARRFANAGLRRAALVAGLALAACSREPPVVQPIQFSHKAHVEKGLPCDGCHQSVQKASFAGMPSTETCMMCHQGALTDNPEEEKVRQFAEKGQQIPWRRVYQVAGHVYFSHRRHVTLGHIECVQCHGDVGEAAKPLTVAAVPIRMDRCMGCHAQKGASADCDACHR